MKKPVIGFTFDFESGSTQEGSYSKMPYYAIRENYCTAVSELGAIPFPLVHENALIEDFMSKIDGLIIIGGAFDVHPSLYGDNAVHDTVVLKEKRTRFEWDITRAAIDRKMPILGICGGEQLLNVVLGGSLIQHIPDTIANSLPHEQPNPRTEAGHSVAVTEGTLLHRITGATLLDVNSAHHQAVAKAASNCVVNAVAEDGVIEGIELPQSQHPFCLGVQWHPEYHIGPGDKKIFEAFLAASDRK
ncbi:MAG: gamma-glutamyl-gamma-aminobutyrate hydrolase family protein [Alphaproteobacteria bacterium]|nr:gamma-glutamyl-gamma-aminobutyrate hydrolase family protein [Alphaproteobacteria bacterium]